MATIVIAMWFQQSDLASTNHLIMIFIGLVAVAMAVMAIAVVVIAIAASKAMKGLNATVVELKGKMLPLIDSATEISKTARGVLDEAAPKIKVIGDNLVKTSDVARGAVEKMDVTLTDANLRTQRQVARVDGMVSAALTTTAEVAETIANGIKGPAQKIAAILTQAKCAAEGLMEKVKSMAAKSPFGSRTRSDNWPD
jgi:hypothetical protein